LQVADLSIFKDLAAIAAVGLFPAGCFYAVDEADLIALAVRPLLSGFLSARL
jgi:hypothetical protein